jgi:hypothetical protein
MSPPRAVAVNAKWADNPTPPYVDKPIDFDNSRFPPPQPKGPQFQEVICTICGKEAHFFIRASRGKPTPTCASHITELLYIVLTALSIDAVKVSKVPNVAKP